MNDSILLVLPVPFRVYQERLYFESQACNGLRLWLKNFQHVIVAAPLIEDKILNGYSLITSVEDNDRLSCIPLTYAYNPIVFLRNYKKTMRILSPLIDESKYLSFAIGGFWGDWASFAALSASRKQRKFSVWTDRVEHKVVLHELKNKKGIKKLYDYSLAFLTKYLNRKVIKKATLGLFHGNDCFETYSGFVQRSFCVHDIHLSEDLQISETDLSNKLKRQDEIRPIRLVYVGRVDPMKGPEDWVEVMGNLMNRGCSIEPIWVGDGIMLNSVLSKLNKFGLQDSIKFIGNVDNREDLFELVKESDLFIFCHKTPESPRCLIEALMLGCPIVGYESHYPADLVAQFGGGKFVKQDNIIRLTDCIEELINNNNMRKNLIKAASESGKLYSDLKVFKHRSDLIKSYS